jgi:hypothetical protein
MQLSLPIRLTMATCLSVTALLQAQSKPASRPKPSASSAPTAIPAALPTTDPAALPLTPAQRPAHRAEIAYTDNRLTISASNSSLNQILREISRLTGIKITGGVTEERVFGDYGPATPSQVLATLLDGTGSNVLLVQSSGSAPTELILTPRQGGATPPNPNAAGFDDDSSEDAPPNPVAQPIRPRPVTEGNTSPPGQNTTAPNPQSPDPAQQPSPNGVKTPQQIYDQLQRLRQQQQQPPQ